MLDDVPAPEVMLEAVAPGLEEAARLPLVDISDVGALVDGKAVVPGAVLDEPKTDEGAEENANKLEELVETTAGDVPELGAIGVVVKAEDAAGLWVVPCPVVATAVVEGEFAAV